MTWALRHGKNLEKLQGWEMEAEELAEAQRVEARRTIDDPDELECRLLEIDELRDAQRPRALREQVYLSLDEQEIYRGFWDLLGDRPMIGGGFGPSLPGAVPYQVSRQWLADHGFRDLRMQDLIRREFWGPMEEVWLKHLQQSQNEPPKPSSP